MGICHTKSESKQNHHHETYQNPHHQENKKPHSTSAQKVNPPKSAIPNKEIKPKKFLLYYPATFEESQNIQNFGKYVLNNGPLGIGVYLYDDFKEAKKIGKLKDKKTVVFQIELKSYRPKTQGWEEGGEYGFDFGYDGRKNYCAYTTNIIKIKKRVECFKENKHFHHHVEYNDGY
jgi:hypothetical protein